MNVPETLENFDTLVVVAVDDPRELDNPLDRPWCIGSKANLLSCCNTAGVRVPRDAATESDYSACEVDLAKVITRMMVSDYKQIAFDPLLSEHKDRRLRSLIEEAQSTVEWGRYQRSCAISRFMM